MKESKFKLQKEASLAHQLIKSGRLLNELGLETAKKKFQLPHLKQSHLDLFPFIQFEGTSIKDIAKRKGVSKQAISKSVQEMVAMDLLYLETDKKDQRSKRVFFRTSGPMSIQSGFKALESIDQTLKSNLGGSVYDDLLEKISKVMILLESLPKPNQS